MINTKTATWTPIRLVKNIDKSMATFDNEIQRASVWNAAQKSLFIHSLLSGMPVPPMYAIQDNKAMDFLDGKQRSLTIYDFKNNKFSLRLVPEVETEDGEVVDVNGMRYRDLPEDLKNEFDGYPLSVIVIDVSSREQAEEIFYRLNNGTSLKTADKNFAKAISKQTIIDLCGHVLFQRALTKTSLSKMAQRPIVIQSLMLLSGQHNLAARQMRDFLSGNEISADEHEQLSRIYDRLDTIAGAIASDDSIANAKRKKIVKHILGRTNIPSLVPLMAKYEDDDRLQKFFVKFFGSDSKSSVNEEYNEACGAGSTHLTQVERRLDVLEKEYKKM